MRIQNFTTGIQGQFETRRPAASLVTASSGAGTDVVRFSREAAAAFLGHDAAVGAVPRLTTEEFKAKVQQAHAEILKADRFDIAFQEKILNDPYMSRAFGGYLERVRADQVGPISAEKKADAEVVFGRMQILTFLEQFAAKLDELKARREDTPVDLMQLGLKLIQRNGDIQETVDTPLATAGIIQHMGGLGGLSASERATFLERLAKAAVQDLAVQDKRTPQHRAAALSHLQYALGKLNSLGEGKGIVAQYFPEAERIAKELDGAEGTANQFATLAIYLESQDPKTRALAQGRIEELAQKIIAKRKEGVEAGRPANGLENQAFNSLTTIAASSKELFAKVPDWIDAMTGRGLGAEGQKAEAYKPGAGEIATRDASLARFLNDLGKVYSSLEAPADKDAHRKLCEQAQALILESVGKDLSPHITVLVGQLTRHPDLAPKAIELLAPEFIADATMRATAAASAVCGLLDNGQYELAYELFNGPVLTEAKDAQWTSRQAQIFAKATQVAIKTKLDFDCAQPVKEWLATAYLRNVEVAFVHQAPNFRSVKDTLAALSGEGFQMDAQSALDLVGKVQQAQEKFPTNFNHERWDGQAVNIKLRLGLFAPELVSFLAKHPNDVACMDKAKQIIELVLHENQQHGNRQDTDPVGYMHQHLLDILDVASRCEPLSGFVQPIVQAYIHRNINETKRYGRPSQPLPFIERVPTLGKLADKDQLARMITPNDHNERASMALALAGQVETTDYARELVAAFAEANLGREIKDLTDIDRQSFMVAEAAARRSLPNLQTEKATVGLIKAFQQGKAPKEALTLVKTYMPQEIIKSVLQQIDSAEIRDFLEGKVRHNKGDASQKPGAGEVIPVAVVGAGGAVPVDQV